MINGLITEEPTKFHVLFAYTSMYFVVVLKRIVPLFAVAGLSAIVPAGIVVEFSPIIVEGIF